MASRIRTRSCKQYRIIQLELYVLCIIADRTPKYGELIDFLSDAEKNCTNDKSVAEVLCSRVKEAYPHIRIARTKHFYDTVVNIAAPVIKGTKFSESELALYRNRKWIPRIRNPPGRIAVMYITHKK